MAKDSNFDTMHPLDVQGVHCLNISRSGKHWFAKRKASVRREESSKTRKESGATLWFASGSESKNSSQLIILNAFRVAFCRFPDREIIIFCMGKSYR